MNRLSCCIRTIARVGPQNYEGIRHIKKWVAPTQMEITRRKKNLSKKLAEPKRSNFVEWNRDTELYAFNKRLSESFTEQKLAQAFTFKSYIIEEENKQKEMGIEDPKLDLLDNQDLIVKGRDITSEVVKRYLSKSLPHVPEAVIMALHNYLLSQDILATASVHIGTRDIILCDEHPVSEETLANTFLALVGALAESVNVHHASFFVRDFLIVGLAEKDLSELWCPSEPLEVLNNILSQAKRMPVEPRLIGHTARNTLASSFQVAVYSNKELLGSGFGETVQEAKDVAAVNALNRMFGLLDSSRPIRFNTDVNITSS